MIINKNHMVVIVPKIKRNTYFFSDYSSISCGIIINKNDLDSIAKTSLKRFLFIGYLDKNLIKTISEFKNLEDMQLKISNTINFSLILQLYQIKYLTIEFLKNFKHKLIYENSKNNLVMICTNLSNGLEIINKESIKRVYYLCKCDLNNIINLKNLNVIQFENKINNQLINKIN